MNIRLNVHKAAARLRLMTPNPIPSDSTDLRQIILDAAERRFRVYGYNKTTMAEIAQDVNMSAANLYRYFENKQDLAAACAQRCMGKSTAALRDVARRAGQTAAQRLENFVLALLRHTREEAKDQPKINELVDIVARERQAIVHDRIAAHCALIAEILAYGNETGEFDVPDIIAASRSVHATLILFEVPIFLPLFTPEQFEEAGRGVVDLLLKGLRRR